MFDICFENVYLKNDIFKICLRESAKCKRTTQTGRTYYVFVISWTLHNMLPSKPQFVSSDNLFVFFV